MTEAQYYTKDEQGRVVCALCPHGCVISEGQHGRCRVRRNQDGVLRAEAYGVVSGYHVDPIEKKPLYHFYPGSQILSVGSYGCSFRCPWCQNASISQCGVDTGTLQRELSPEEIVRSAAGSDSIGVAYTYNEPTVWFEFMMDIARPVHERGMKNVVVTNGYINPGPLSELLEVADAFNVDLKAFDDRAYREYARARLAPVLKSMKAIASAGKHLEITFLVVPGVNDDLEAFDTMITWIEAELGKEVVLHLSRYFPSWKMHAEPTPVDLLKKMKHMAMEKMQHVYLGNVPRGT